MKHTKEPITITENENYNFSLSSCKQKIEWLEAINKDLLEACRIFVKFDRHHHDCDFITWANKKECTCGIGLAKQAIAKAEGRDER